jgi:hypothetical protein
MSAELRAAPVRGGTDLRCLAARLSPEIAGRMVGVGYRPLGVGFDLFYVLPRLRPG